MASCVAPDLHPCLRPAIVSDVGIEGRLAGWHSSWRVKAHRRLGSHPLPDEGC
jgi:hypothetical protein